jgi:hypothetical protein
MGLSKSCLGSEDLEQDIGLIHRTLGLKGLESIPNISMLLAKDIEELLCNYQLQYHSGS